MRLPEMPQAKLVMFARGGGSGWLLQDWQVLTQQAELDLAPAELHGWFGQLKQQRRLLTRAVEELQRVPAVEGEQGVLPGSESARYQQLLGEASSALLSYGKSSPSAPPPHLLRKAMLEAAARAGLKWHGQGVMWQGVMRMGGLLDMLLPLFPDDERQQQVVCWINTLRQLCDEHAAASAVEKAAEKLMVAAKWLAPRATRRPAHELQREVERLQAELAELCGRTSAEVEQLVRDTRQLTQPAAGRPVSHEAAELPATAELGYGSLLGHVAGMLLGPLKEHKVVLVTANKVLYWELLRLLMKLGIGHEHLDPKEWVACKRLPGKLREAPRNRREGLDRFRQGESRVLVLNVLDPQQAVGITLTCVHHMLVLDPLLEEATLHQVLSRIHRYGQKHEQHVTFLVAAGSINKLLHNRYVPPALQRFMQQGQQQELLEQPEAAAAAAAAAAANPDEAAGVADQPAEMLAAAAAVAAGGNEGAAVCRSSRGAGQELPAAQVVALLKQHLGVQ
ncbi:hypothetical protein OEZ85_004819 [Tetradesmus obliquus]|uniref:Helicase C-terminal domain-containing protein n=1 Tax=Tetradesmus obliquus TaxID=3088 RepID=A0ABY8UG89_TETOB|nr:hypothetical protein OEZ85_004819 [Tetradesmus obliquus]